MQVASIDDLHVKHVLATGFENFGKGDAFMQVLCVVPREPNLPLTRPSESLLQNGIFNRDGELWKMVRVPCAGLRVDHTYSTAP